jgi:hypothetical protein
LRDRGFPWSVQHPTVVHPEGAAAEALAKAEEEVEVAVVEVEEAVVEVAVVAGVAGTVLLVFDLKAVNRQDPPHFE